MSMKVRHNYVEFVGQHTAGKTSTYRYVVEEKLLSPYVAMHPRLPEFRRPRIHFALSIPFLVVKNINQIWFVTYFFLRYAKWRWTNYRDVWQYLIKMVILHPYYKRYEYDVWFKQDMLHLLPRTFFKEEVDIERVFTEYFDHFAHLYNGIVYVDLSSENMQKRFAERHKGKSEKRQQNRRAIYEQAYKQNILMKEVLLAQNSVPVLVIDGNGSVEENAHKVAEFVRAKVLSR